MKSVRQLVIAAALGGLSAVAAAADFGGLYVFGDSLADSGNVARLVGSDPGQVITGNSYIPSRPYASGQFTNGDVWVKGFASSLGLAPFGAPSLDGGGDYAFGGARVASDGGGQPPSLRLQTTLFLNAHQQLAPADALYVVAGGGNDARDALAAAAGSATPDLVIAAAASAYAQATGNLIDRLQAAGAAHIVVWDVPDLALAPAVLAQGSGASFLGGQVSIAMNSALSARLAIETGVTLFDVYGWQNRFVADPAAWGLTNVSDACGAPTAGCDPASALFWDGIHPTAAGHALLAAQMLAAVTPVPEPASAALLLIGGAALLLLLRRTRRAGTALAAARAAA